jgi:hypothetical protein
MLRAARLSHRTARAGKGYLPSNSSRLKKDLGNQLLARSAVITEDAKAMMANVKNLRSCPPPWKEIDPIIEAIHGLERDCKAFVEVTSQRFRLIEVYLPLAHLGPTQGKRSPIDDHKLVGW